MGNFCSDNPYSQLKQTYQKDFQKLVENHQLQKQLNTTVDAWVQKFNASAQLNQNQHINTIDFISKQIKEHFQKLKQEIDKSYTGGVAFLQKEKNQKIQVLLGYNMYQEQSSETKENIKIMFERQKNETKNKLLRMKESQLRALKETTPLIKQFECLSQKLKQQIYAKGQRQYKKSIAQQIEQLVSRARKHFSLEEQLKSLETLIPVDKMELLTKITKHQMSAKAAKLIHHTNEQQTTSI